MGKSGGKRKKSASAVGDGGTKLDSDDAVSFQRPEMPRNALLFYMFSMNSQLCKPASAKG